jgi:hypothetical protein
MKDGQGAHVARRVAHQVVDDFRRQFEGAFPGLGGEGGGLFAIGQRLQAIDQPGAEAGAQVFAQREMGRRLAGCGQQHARRPFSAG